MLGRRQLSSQLRLRPEADGRDGQATRLSDQHGVTDESVMRCCLCGRSHFPTPWSSSASSPLWVTSAEYELVQWDVLTFVHPLCLQVCSALTLKSSGDALRREAQAARQRVCRLCARRGATVKCDLCPSFFHLPCYLLSQADDDRGSLPVRCSDHVENQGFKKERTNTVKLKMGAKLSLKSNRDDKALVTNSPTRRGTCGRTTPSKKKPIVSIAMTTMDPTSTVTTAGVTTTSTSASSNRSSFDQSLCRIDHCVCPKGRNYYSPTAWSLVFCRQCEVVSSHLHCSKTAKNNGETQSFVCSSCCPSRSNRRGRPTTRSTWGGSAGVNPSTKNSSSSRRASSRPIQMSTFSMTPSPSSGQSQNASASASDKENESALLQPRLSTSDKKKALKRARHIFSDDLDHSTAKKTRSKSREQSLTKNIKTDNCKTRKGSTNTNVEKTVAMIPDFKDIQEPEPVEVRKTEAKKGEKLKPKKSESKKTAPESSKSKSEWNKPQKRKSNVKKANAGRRPKKPEGTVSSKKSKSSLPLSPAKKFVEESVQRRPKRSHVRRQTSVQDPVPLCERTLHHVKTNLPIVHGEIEAEEDYSWLPNLSARQIDEFVDLNVGEKAFMQLWNTHMFAYPCYGDRMLVEELYRFVDLRGTEIVRQSLYSNFVLHLVNLHDHQVFDAVTLNDLIKRIQSVEVKNNIGVDDEGNDDVVDICDTSTTAISVVVGGGAGCVRRSLQPVDEFVKQELIESNAEALVFKDSKTQRRRRRSEAA